MSAWLDALAPVITGLMLIGIGFMWGATWQGDRARKRLREEAEFQRRRFAFWQTFWSQQLVARTPEQDAVDALVGRETYREGR